MSLPASMTVTATETAATGVGIVIHVKVLTGFAASPIGATAASSTSGAPNISLTTTVTGSRVYGALTDNRYNSSANNAGAGGFATLVNSGTTAIDNWFDAGNTWTGAFIRATSATGTPGAASYGYTDGSTWRACALLEILANGTVTEDASGPALVHNYGQIFATTASFTPPGGSLLVAMVSTEGNGAGTTTVSVTNDGAITFTEQIKSNLPTGSGYSGIWTARVPVLTSSDTVTLTDSPGSKTVVGAADSDAGSALDAQSLGTVHLSTQADAYLGSDAESARPVGPFPGIETATGTDAGPAAGSHERIKPVSATNLADTATGTDSDGFKTIVGSTVFITQTGALGDASRFPQPAPPPIQQNVSDGDFMTFLPEHEFLFVPPSLIFQTGFFGENWHFLDGHALPAGTNPSDADTGHGTEIEKTAFPKSADAGSGTERELSSHPQSSDVRPPAVEGASQAVGGGFARTAKNRAGWLHFDSSTITSATITAEAPRRSFVAFNSWEANYLAPFRAAKGTNDLKLIIYQCMSSARSFDPGPGGRCSGGLGQNYAWVTANHPEWIITRSGSPSPAWTGYPGTYQMNVGLQAYQDYWAANVIGICQSDGWDGIFMDNVLWQLTQYGIGPCDQWATDTAMQTAYKSFVSRVVTQFNSAGLLCLPNISNARLVPTILGDYRTLGLESAFDEFWLCFGSGSELPDYSQGWHVQVAEMTDSPRYSVAQSHSAGLGTTQEFRYCYASWACSYATDHDVFLMEADGTNNYAQPVALRTENGWDLGQPVAGYFAVPGNALCFRRDFTGGQFGGTPSVPGVIALVNANTSGTMTLALPGTYTDQSGNHITTAVVPFGSGMVLRLGSL